MSDFRAIGGVSATLQALLLDRMEWPGATRVPVTVGPPRFTRPEDQGKAEDARVNLFLYRVTENGYLQNQEIPGRGGSDYGHPPLSLNLHYLLTAYGSDLIPGATPATTDEKLAHFLLGSAMRVLHDVPVVTDGLTTVRAPSGETVLHDSLREASEQVKLMLEPLSLEDITKVWTALSLRYRLSAAYAIHVVQIESRRPRTFPRPVAPPVGPHPSADVEGPGPAIHVVTIRVPSITEVGVRRAGSSTEQPYPYVRIGDTVVLRGLNLAGGRTDVAFGDLEVPAAVALDDRAEAVVPDLSVPGVGPIAADQLLRPGPLAIRVVVHDALVPSRSSRSNELAVQLVPRIDGIPTVAPGPPRTIKITGKRLVTAGSSGELILGRSSVPVARYQSAADDQVVVPVPDTLPGSDVRVFLGGGLGPSVTLGPQPQELSVTIGAGAPQTVRPSIPTPITPTASAPILQAAIRDGGAADPAFAGLRVGLAGDRLVLIPGDLQAAITVSSPAPSTLAGDLLLTAAQPPGIASVMLSGELDPFPRTSADTPRLILTIGATTAPLSFARPTSLTDLATTLEAAIRGASATTAFTGAIVGVVAGQLVIIPGAAGTVAFAAAPSDPTSVAELRLHASYLVRIRVNGAESVDPVTVGFPA